jgi:2,4-dienoyl-CoA reductase-like NADH-dependent reductase (Old Yellow Enzyme family)
MRKRLADWAAAGTRGNNHLWMQISHSGRQTQALINPHPKAPSAVPLGLPGKQFGTPIALTDSEIVDLIARFALAVRVARDTGFTGAQIHGAHGYLISQFLSPRANKRDDKWGGSLENRARFLLDIIRASRAAVGPAFPISVKLNSADFQKGGFAFEESLTVARWLEAASVDLIEVSGGSYEQPRMMNTEGIDTEEPKNMAPSTAAREAYFVDFAKATRAAVKIPVMVTGGLRTRKAMLHAVESGAADVVGIGRPMCVDTDAPARIFKGEEALLRWEQTLKLLPSWLSFLKNNLIVRALEGLGVLYWFYAQLYRLGRGQPPDRKLGVFPAFREVDAHHRRLAKEIKATAAR